MARSKEATRRAKAAYSRQYRKDHPEMKTKDNRRTVDAGLRGTKHEGKWKRKWARPTLREKRFTIKMVTQRTMLKAT